MAYKTQKQGQMSASEVKKMQTELIKKGYDVGSTGADGIWGANTAAALSKYKKDTGGSNTYGNSVGNETLQKLYGTSSSGKNSNNKTAGTSGNGSGIMTGMGMLKQFAQYASKVASNPILASGAGQYAALNNLYDSQLNTLKDGVNQYVTTLESGANNANAALEEARQNALAGIEQTYNDSARNYYRLYRAQENELPEQLSSIGATGGATESAALRLMNNYSDNLYKNENSRNQDVNGLNEDYYNAVAQNSAELASQIANAYLQQAQQVAALQADKYNSQQQIFANTLAAYKEQKAAEAEAEQKAKIVKWNNAVHEKEADRQWQGYTTTNWTDADGYYHYRIDGKKTTKKGGSKSKGKSKDDSSSGGSGSTSTDASVVTNDHYVQAALRYLNGSGNIFSGLYNNVRSGVGGAVNYIENPRLGLSSTQKSDIYDRLRKLIR